jgi:uracil-DNA glycosylase family 4
MARPSAAAALPAFSAECQACPRLSAHLASIRETHPNYYAKPVLPFGDDSPRLLVVGLAPGMHGANRTGRPFTGDYAGILLYDTLHRYGYGSRADAVAADDGLVLSGCRITNAVKCLPPQNKPQPDEVRRCNGHLKSELAALPAKTAILALGAIAHHAVLMAFDLRRSDYVFAHAAQHAFPSGHTLFDSYHCSRYNTQTKRLSAAMFHDVFDAIARHSERR